MYIGARNPALSPFFNTENDLRYFTWISDGGQYQTQGYRLNHKNGATQHRNDGNTKLQCCSIGRFPN
jgi:hypothetical protein